MIVPDNSNKIENYLASKPISKDGKISDSRLAGLYLALKKEDWSPTKISFSKFFVNKDNIEEARGELRKYNADKLSNYVKDLTTLDASHAGKIAYQILNSKDFQGLSRNEVFDKTQFEQNPVSLKLHSLHTILKNKKTIEGILPKNSEVHRNFKAIEDLQVFNENQKTLEDLVKLSEFIDKISWDEHQIRFLKQVAALDRNPNVDAIIECFTKLRAEVPAIERRSDSVIALLFKKAEGATNLHDFCAKVGEEADLQSENEKIWGSKLLKTPHHEVFIQKLSPLFIGVPNESVIRELNKIMQMGTELIKEKKYPPEAIANGCYEFLKREIDKGESLKAPTSKEKKDELSRLSEIGAFNEFYAAYCSPEQLGITLAEFEKRAVLFMDLRKELIAVSGHPELAEGFFRASVQKLMEYSDIREEKTQLTRMMVCIKNVAEGPILFEPKVLENSIEGYIEDHNIIDIILNFNVAIYDVHLFENGLVTAALKMSERPHYQEASQKQWLLKLQELIPKKDHDYIAAFIPFCKGPVDLKKIDEFKVLIHIANSLIPERRKEELIRICTECFSDHQQIKKTITKTSLKLFLPYLNPIGGWETALPKSPFTEKFIQEFNQHADLKGPISRHEVEALQALSTLGSQMVKHYPQEPIVKGMVDLIKSYRSDGKILDQHIKANELFGFSLPYQKEINGWDAKMAQGRDAFSKILLEQIRSSEFLGPVSEGEVNLFNRFYDLGSSIVEKNGYPPEAVARGIRRAVEQARQDKRSLESLKFQELIPYCFEGLVEMGSNGQTTEKAISLFIQIKNRNIPLTQEGQERLLKLVEMAVSPSFAMGMTLDSPAVRGGFSRVLESLRCSDINALNTHPYSPEMLSRSLYQYQASKLQFVNLEQVTHAIEVDPIHAASLVFDQFLPFLAKGKQKEAFQRDLGVIFNAAGKGEGSQALGNEINRRLNQLGPIHQALQLGPDFDIEISTEHLIQSGMDDLKAMRKDIGKGELGANEQEYGILGMGLMKFSNLISQAQNERKEKVENRSFLATLLPDIPDMLKSIRFKIFILKVADKIGILKPIVSYVIKSTLNDQIKKMNHGIQELEKMKEVPVEKIATLKGARDLLMNLKNESGRISGVAVPLFLTLVDRHKLSLHHGLFDYLKELAKDEKMEVDQNVLTSHLLDSTEILLKEAQIHYPEIAEKLVTVLRSLPKRESIVPKASQEATVKKLSQHEQKILIQNFDNFDSFVDSIAKHVIVGEDKDHLAETALFLFKQMKLDAPLTQKGKENLMALVTQTLQPGFSQEYPLIHPYVAEQFHQILSDEKCQSASQLNAHKSKEALVAGFEQNGVIRFSKIDMGKVREAVIAGPKECVQNLAMPVLQHLMEPNEVQNSKTAVFSLIDAAFQTNAGKGIADLMRKGMNQLKGLNAAKIDVNLTTQNMTSALKDQSQALREKLETEKKIPLEEEVFDQALVGVPILRFVNSIVTSQIQRQKGGKELPEVNLWLLGNAIPALQAYANRGELLQIPLISKIIPILASGAESIAKTQFGKKGIIKILQLLSRKKIESANKDIYILELEYRPLKIEKEQIAHNITESKKELNRLNNLVTKDEKKIEYLEMYTKILEEKLKTCTKRLEELETEIEGAKNTKEIFIFIAHNHEAVAEALVPIGLSLLKRHDLNKHAGLFDYLAKIGQNPDEKVNPEKLMALALNSFDVILDEINEHYPNLVSDIITEFRFF